MKVNIRDYLTDKGGNDIELPATIDINDLFGFAGIDDAIDVDIHELLDEHKQIAVIWCIEDVQAVRPDLSDDQAWQVLKDVRSHHDAELGINWQTLKCVADMLFGNTPENDQAWRLP